MSEDRRKEDKLYQANIKLLHDIQARERKESDRKKQAAIARSHSNSRDSRYI